MDWKKRRPSVKTVYKEEPVRDVMKFYSDFDIDNPSKIVVEAGYGCGSLEREVMIDTSNFDLGWISGSEAINLGQILIKHGLIAMEKNKMVQHLASETYKYDRFIREGRIDYIQFEALEICELGRDAKIRIHPIWIKGREPKEYEDFCFDVLINISIDAVELERNLKKWTYALPYKFTEIG